MLSQSTIDYCVKKFGIKPEEVKWYNSGSCYDRIGVSTKEAADKVSQKVEGETANGGMMHGMPLGGQSEYKDEATGETHYDVTC